MTDPLDNLFFENYKDEIKHAIDKGLISKIHVASCHNCDNLYFSNAKSRPQMKPTIERHGWKQVYEGWLCPACQNDK